jgi:ubiquinone/menaquinone biosynthesis C-methylase UbiE
MLSIEEIKLLIEKLEKIDESDFKEIIHTNLQVLKELAAAVEINNSEQINRLDKTKSWFELDNQHKKEKPYIDEMTRTAIQNKIFQFGRTNKFNSLEIGPGNGMFSKDFRAWRLNYFLDALGTVEKSIRKKFPVQHQKYLQFFTTNKTECLSIPLDSCNFIFSWDTFVFFTETHIKEYLRSMKRVLIPGGYCMIHYADCHYDFDLEQTKRGYWNYNTKTTMEKLIKEEGYQIVEFNQFKPGQNYAVFKKPGKQNPVLYKVSEFTLD